MILKKKPTECLEKRDLTVGVPWGDVHSALPRPDSDKFPLLFGGVLAGRRICAGFDPADLGGVTYFVIPRMFCHDQSLLSHAAIHRLAKSIQPADPA